MSTRFYIANVFPGPLVAGTFAIHANWTESAQRQYALLKTRPVAGSFAWSPITITKGSATTPYNGLMIQAISDPLPYAITINQQVRIFIPGLTSADIDAYLQVIVRVFSGDGSTLRGNLYTGQATGASSATYASYQYEMPSGASPASTRELAFATVSTNALVGDRIQIEIGMRSHSATTGTTLSLYANSPEIADDYDRVVQTLLDARGRRAWIEFDQDLFGTPGTEEYKMGDGGVILNTTASLPFVDVTNVDGLDSAPSRLSTNEREGMHGGFVDSGYDGVRTVTLEGNVYASPTALETYLDRLKLDYRASKRPMPFYFGTDAGVRCVLGRPQGIRFAKTSQRRLGIVPFQVQIVCDDPRIYLATREHATVDIGNTTSLAVSGNRDIPVLFHLKPLTNLTNPTISLISAHGNTTFAYTGLITIADDLVIDIDARTVTLNGQNARSQTTVTGVWGLPAPPLMYVSASAFSGTGRVTLAYRQAYE